MNAVRRTLLLGAASSLAGCGFRPLYGTIGNGGTVRPELASIYVAVMTERQGQLLRQALQRRFEGSDSGVAKRYELTGSMTVAGQAIGVQSDSSSTRTRLNAVAPWSLHQLDPKRTVLASGTARATSGININDQQYFAADLEQSSAVRGLAETVAEEITLDIAAFFRRRAETA